MYSNLLFYELNKDISMRITIFALAVFIVLVSPVKAAQQKWAAAYVNWTFDSAPNGRNLDQQIWLPTPSYASFFTMNWNWTNTPNVGGYMGLQTDAAGDGNVRFSLWNATEAKGTDCRTFGGEGVGYTCMLPIKIDSNKYYRLRLWRTAGDNSGQWWGGWLIEEKDGNLIEHAIGQIKVAANQNTFSASSVSNFSEYWGTAVSTCDQVPISIAGFSPPAINYKGEGTGIYEAYSKLAGGTLPDGNICKTGSENQGADTTFKPYNFEFGEGMIVFMGGKATDHTLDRKPLATVPDS
jgi:hypothetical protein